MKCRFIINKSSGNGFGKKRIAEMENYFLKTLGSFDYVMPKDSDEAVLLTREFLRQDVERIVAVGGDGTINAIVNGFFENGKNVRDEAILVVTKAGSGCDYYKSVTKSRQPKSWMELVTSGNVIPVDVGRIQFADGSREDRYFVNMASVGMIADIVKSKEERSSLVPRPLRYIIPTIECLFSSKPHRMGIKTDSDNFSVEALTVSIAKGTYAGGGMQFGLDVSLSDGQFEVTIIEKTNPAGMAFKLGKLFSGDYLNVKGIRKLKTARIEFNSQERVQCEFDGEAYGTTDLVITLLPKALRVCFPEYEETNRT